MSDIPSAVIIVIVLYFFFFISILLWVCCRKQQARQQRLRASSVIYTNGQRREYPDQPQSTQGSSRVVYARPGYSIGNTAKVHISYEEPPPPYETVVINYPSVPTSPQ